PAPLEEIEDIEMEIGMEMEMGEEEINVDKYIEVSLSFMLFSPLLTDESQEADHPGPIELEAVARRASIRTSRLPARYCEFNLSAGFSFLETYESPEPVEEEEQQYTPHYSPSPQQSQSTQMSQQSEPSDEGHPNQNLFYASNPNRFGIFQVHHFNLPSREPEIGINDLADSHSFNVQPTFE
ncbi:hypothetical protein VNI00_017125, partial [Paramarasmius palmivorus]